MYFLIHLLSFHIVYSHVPIKVWLEKVVLSTTICNNQEIRGK